MKNFCIFALLLTTSLARQGFGPGEQDWDFVEVKPQAYMFWWLYETTANVTNATERPLVIWLQGGPGDSSTGSGNFAQIGPLDENLNERNYTWVKDVNLLFIDNPVGTGFSYVENTTAYTRNNDQIALDLIACMEGFYQKWPEFQSVPLYITSQSYGGKMAAEFALQLHKGAIDQEGYAKVDKAAKLTSKLYVEGKFVESYSQWSDTQDEILEVSNSVNLYNILKKIKTKCSQSGGALTDCGDPTNAKLKQIMDNEVKEALNITENWKAQSATVFNKLTEDFMKPVTQIVEELLNTTPLKVQVVISQLDLIVNTPGTVSWVDSLQWDKSKEWPSAPRSPLSVNNVNEGYKKNLGKLTLYWVNRSGRMVPVDNPKAMSSILADLIA